MRNIIRFILRYHFFLLFLLFETLSFYLLVNYNQHQHQLFLNSSGRLATSIFELTSNFRDYFSLRRANDELSRENALLRSRVYDYASSGEIEKHNSPQFTAQRDSQYLFTPAKVINNSVNKLHNYLTINAGKLQGVKSGMGVISARGLVGITRHVSDHYATVISLLNTQLKISAKLRDSDFFGSLTWKGGAPGQATLYEIPGHAKLSVGDAVITSGYSAIFPEGILIGTIENYELKQGEGFYEITVKLSVDFSRLTYVEVVEKISGKEQKELEKTTEDD
ncbi:rod shape-determining protein MreC [Geofilum sp. OHC36d9]|uniref:rod shape-determining protein MreC n=1 Tax=Geofilum sp. OHC36d9 TaxID=3458413 RepID=UPI004033E8CF